MLGLLGVVSFCLLVPGPALAALKPDPLPVPKPQPKRPPPPPPRAPAPPPPPPPTFEPPPPPAVVSPQPSAAEVAAAARRSAAALAAQRRAARIAAARRRAAKLAALAKSRPIEIQPPSAAADEALAPVSGSGISLAPVPPDRESGGVAVPIILVLGALALVLLGMAVVPAHIAPWYWVEDFLALRRPQFAISGVMSLVAAGIFFAFMFLSG